MDGGPRFLEKPVDEKIWAETFIQLAMLIHSNQTQVLCTYKVHCIDEEGTHTHETEGMMCVPHSLGLQRKQGHSVNEGRMLTDESGKTAKPGCNSMSYEIKLLM